MPIGFVGAAVIIGAALSAGGLAYSIFAGERARHAAAQSEANARNDIRLQQEAEERRLRQERIDSQELLFRQQAEQKATSDRLRQEQDATLAKVKGEVPGIQAKLGEDLLGQQQKAYAKMDPQIEARLNALGLLNSGALVEAKVKAQGDLESQRQAALADFGTNAASRLSIDQPLANSSADIGRQYDSLQRNLDLDKTNLSQRFSSDAAAAANDVSRSQYLAGLTAATNSANQNAASSYLNASAQLGTGLLGYAASRPAKAKTSYSPSLDALYKARDSYNTAWQGPRR